MEKRFKFKKMYPGLHSLLRPGSIGEKINEFYYKFRVDENLFVDLHKSEVEKWPEFFEEIKEPLFVTEDGVYIYDQETIMWGLHKESYSMSYATLKDAPNLKYWLWFSKPELRGKWIEDNNPKFSKKQILDAYDNLLKHSVINNSFVHWKTFLNELGI